MSRVKVRSEVLVYEVNGAEVKSPHAKDAPRLIVESDHRSGWIVLRLGDGQSITVAAADLEAATRNATNTGGW